jgi:hypothetical protein
MAVSPGAAGTYTRMGLDFDIRAALPSIQVSTLCLVRSKDENLPATRYIASTCLERDSWNYPARFTTLHSVTGTLPFR